MQLNAEQSKAVCFSPNHPLLLTAGPGSGKTLTLLHRVIRLTSELTPGIDESMLLLTFSKAAVGEMISRLQVHNISYSICQVMTFHSFAFKFIKTHYIEAGYRVTPKVASKAERLQIMKEAIDLLNLLDLKKILADKKRTNELLKFLADAKRAFDLDAFFGDNCVQSMKDLYRCVQRLLQEKCLLEFDDMIPLTNSCFQRNPLLLAQYWGKYRYILCDEYQDTNARQRQLLLLLGTSGRITAVGDKDQLIYGFQGADVNNFKLFDFAFRSIGGAKRMALQTNYRSRGPIIRVCNDIIRHNHDEGDKGSMMRAAADRESGDAVRIVECLGTVDCELRHVLEWAQGLLRTHRVTHAEDMAVLCRDNDTANKVGQFIKKHTQDFGISLSLGNLEDDEEVKSSPVQQYLAKLALALNPLDDKACDAALPPHQSDDDDSMRGTIDQALACVDCGDRLSLLEILRSVHTSVKLKNWIKGVDHLVNVLAEDAVSLPNFVNKVVHSCVHVRDLKRKYSSLGGVSEHEPRALNDDLRAAASQWYGERRRSSSSLREMVTGFVGAMRARLRDGGSLSVGPPSRSGSDLLWVGTIHKAKGRQFKAVLVVNATEDTFGRGRAVYSEAAVAEDRRLLYVAASRAEEVLCMSFTGAYSPDTQRNRLSSFLTSAITLDAVQLLQFPEMKSVGASNIAGAPATPLPLKVLADKNVKNIRMHNSREIKVESSVKKATTCNPHVSDQVAVILTVPNNLLPISISPTQSADCQKVVATSTTLSSSGFQPRSGFNEALYASENQTTTQTPDYSSSRSVVVPSTFSGGVRSLSFFSYTKDKKHA